MKLVPDTSVVIDGRITSMLREGEYKGSTIIIPEAVIAELESQANQGREIGFSGLIELQELSKMAEAGEIELFYVGDRPSLEQVKLASGGEIDAIIRNVALEFEDARFITSDIVQAEVARAKGIDVLYLKPQVGDFSPLSIERFFDEKTVSVTLKERVRPIAKKGEPGKMKLEPVHDVALSEYDLRQTAQEILERAKRDPEGYIEIERRGITVVQIGALRISIARRPFTDAMEITAVRPVRECVLEDYAGADIVRKCLGDAKGGVIIAGTPGSGKTTLVRSIAIYLANAGYQVSSMESPRDLHTPEGITQFTALDGSMVQTASVLLMARPDFVIFDEIRKDEDFGVFVDMRLSGVGMVGVLDGADVLEALQRILLRVDFGVAAMAASTIISIKEGRIQGIYRIDYSIRQPTEMPESFTARPIISVTDLQSGKLIGEAFRYEGETVILPVSRGEVARPEPIAVTAAEIVEEEPAPVEEQAPEPEIIEENLAWKVAEREIQHEIGRFTDGPVKVRMLTDNKAVVYIDDRDVPAAIGKGGKNVAGIVNKLSIGIDIRPLSEFEEKEERGGSPKAEGISTSEGIELRTDKKNLSIISPENAGKIVDVFGGKEYLFTATVNDEGEITVAKSSTIAQDMIRRFEEKEVIRLKPVGN
jgi:ATPase